MVWERHLSKAVFAKVKAGPTLGGNSGAGQGAGLLFITEHPASAGCPLKVGGPVGKRGSKGQG